MTCDWVEVMLQSHLLLLTLGSLKGIEDFRNDEDVSYMMQSDL